MGKGISAMQLSGTRPLARLVLTGLFAVATTLPARPGDAPKGDAPQPAATIVLGPGRGTATPLRQGSARTGGGNIHVTQPEPDTLSVTMTGVAVATGHPCQDSVAGFSFDLSQSFEVAVHTPRIKGAKLILWGRSVGLLRSDCCGEKCGSAEVSTPGHATVSCGPTEVLALGLPPRAVACGENVSVHDRAGPVWVSVLPGTYTLRQTFGITASHRKGLFGKPVSAEFAPDPALEAQWISKREPFHGAAKKDLGFQVILKVVADDEGGGGGDKP
jgi:hypothetical protein